MVLIIVLHIILHKVEALHESSSAMQRHAVDLKLRMRLACMQNINPCYFPESLNHWLVISLHDEG